MDRHGLETRLLLSEMTAEEDTINVNLNEGMENCLIDRNVKNETQNIFSQIFMKKNWILEINLVT